MTLTINIPDESAMLMLGRTLAQACQHNGAWIYLSGELGAGKTTLVRGFMRESGYNNRVKSPTYALVESYDMTGQPTGGNLVYHFDFYRINAAEQLVMMGLEEYFTLDAVCLVEWPQHAESILPTPDITVSIQSHAASREVTIAAQTSRGAIIMDYFAHE